MKKKFYFSVNIEKKHSNIFSFMFNSQKTVGADIRQNILVFNIT